LFAIFSLFFVRYFSAYGVRCFFAYGVFFRVRNVLFSIFSLSFRRFSLFSILAIFCYLLFSLFFAILRKLGFSRISNQNVPTPNPKT